MPQLVKQGFVYIAQPPLYQVARKKRIDYVEDDAQLNRILIQIGTEEVRLRNLADSNKELTQKQLEEILELLEALNKYARGLRRHGGDFAEYLEHRSPETNEVPRHLVKVRSGNDETVHYFHTEEELAQFSADHPDLRLFGSAVTEEESENNVDRSRPAQGQSRRARHVELHENTEIDEVLKKLS